MAPKNVANPILWVRKIFYLCFLVTPFLQLTLIGEKPLWLDFEELLKSSFAWGPPVCSPQIGPRSISVKVYWCPSVSTTAAPLNNGLLENYHQIFKCLENRHKFDMTANIKIVHNGLQIRPLQVTS